VTLADYERRIPYPGPNLATGLFACNGTDGGTCGQTGLTAPNITTIVSFYARRATVVAARGNYSIVSVADTTVRLPLGLEHGPVSLT